MATTRLDKFGRIVIPKPIRDALGLEPGTELDIAQENGAINIRPTVLSPQVKRKGHILVFTGKAEGDLLDAVRKQREERARKVAGMEWS
ncbi:MAG: AbrB/MazE/SpoVT family DNA-binding domain-containing protein [Planctomycetota bacterium]